MPIAVRCPKCGSETIAPDHFEGRKVRCRVCKTEFVAGSAVLLDESPPPKPSAARKRPPPVREAVGSGRSSALAPVTGPKSQPPIPVPSATSDDDREGASAGSHWLVLGAVLLISLAVGAAGGFVFGHRQGKSDDRRELAEALAQPKSLADRLKAADEDIAGTQAERERLKVELATAREREGAAIVQARAYEEKLAAAARAEADALDRQREQENRKAEAAKKVQAARGNPTKVLFKDFANFPEEHAGGCVRFDGVWLDGDLIRVEGTKYFSPGVSSPDGKHIFGHQTLRFADGAVFVISEEIGRPLSIAFESNKKYGVNLCCEVTKNGKQCLARIYRVETRTVGGDIKDVFEEK
jgi:hypothetical protein